MRTPRLHLLILAATALLCACGEKPVRPNVLIITVDTLRADRLGCYGYPNAQTPAMDRLAQESVRFEQALAQVPLTWPSHASLFTATYPFSNGVQDFTGQPLDASFRTLAEAMKASGYATGAVVSSFVLDRSWGLARGFDFYDDSFSGQDFLTKDVALVERRAGDSVDRALAWLQGRAAAKEPFFFWLHLFDPHSPYDAPEPFGSRHAAKPYDGEVAYTDHELGRLLDWLRAQRQYDSTLIILLSDHGEALGDHGESEHGFFVYNATMHVPLLIKPQKAANLPPRVVTEPVGAIAVAETVLDLSGLQDEAFAAQAQSRSLRGHMGAAKLERESLVYGETFYPKHSFGWSPLRSLQAGPWKYIAAPQPELYDLRSDPQEARNLVGQETQQAEQLRAGLHRLIQRYPPRKPTQGPGPSEEAMARLRSLGYVASRAPESSVADQDLPDPKEKVEQYHAILRATDLLRGGDVPAARALLERVRRSEPKLYLVPFLLGEAASRQGQWPAAERELNRALELNPTFDQAMTALAGALASQEKNAAAKTWLERALAINPQNFRAWYALARVELRTDPAAAVRALEKALAIQPSFAPAHRDLGMAAFQRQDFNEAARRLEKAVEYGLDDARLYNFLGIAYSRTGALDRATSAYQKSLERDPNHAEARLNLGFAYERMGRMEEAKREYDAACRLDRKICEMIRKRNREVER
jgi:arylsulfatase A-like enzyme/Tfp pilus assembly protein PilF